MGRKPEGPPKPTPRDVWESQPIEPFTDAEIKEDMTVIWENLSKPVQRRG